MTIIRISSSETACWSRSRRSATRSDSPSRGRRGRSCGSAGASYGSTPRPSANVRSFSVSVPTNSSGRFSKRLLEARHALEPAAVGQAARSRRRAGPPRSPPAADRVEVLEREAHGIHQLVTARAGDVGAVLGQPLADRERRRDRVVLERRHVRRRRRRRRAEDVLEDPLAADHRRRAGRVRGDRQDAPLAEQAAPHAVVAELDAPELAAVDVRDAVVLGQPLVQVRVVRLRAGRARCDPRAGRSRTGAPSPGGRPAAGCRRSRGTGAGPA